MLLIAGTLLLRSSPFSSSSISGVENYDFIPPEKDGRVSVSVSAEPDFKAIGVLRTPTKQCTATLVGPDTILTAAHCVVDELSQKFESSGTFCAGYQKNFLGVEKCAAEANVSEFAVPGNYDSKRKLNDIAFARLDRPIRGALSKVFKLRPLQSHEYAKLGKGGYAKANQAGYSSDRPGELTRNQSCEIEGYRYGKVLNSCQTVTGDSGSPVYWGANGSKSIFAVVSHANFSIKGDYLGEAASPITQPIASAFQKFSAGRLSGQYEYTGGPAKGLWFQGYSAPSLNYAGS